MDKPAHEFDWSQVFEPNSDLQRFRLALHAGNSVAEARAIAAAKAPQDYDAARDRQVRTKRALSV